MRPTTSTAEQAESTRLRLTFLALLVVSLFVLLFARLWFLQVMAGEAFRSQAEGNAVREIVIEAPRGKILDRHGTPIVQNRYAPVVSVQPDEMGERADEVFAELAALLGEPVDDLVRRAESVRYSRLRPRPVAIDASPDVVAYIHENGPSSFPGVYAETVPLREYLYGSTASHLVGYLGEITDKDLESDRYAGYRGGELIGRTGVEYQQEPELRGVHGRRRLEVDARQRVLRDLGEVLPVPGSDVLLTIDLDVQSDVEAALAEGIAMARTIEDEGEGPGRGGTYKAPAGAVVVVKVETGEVLAMASYPDYEPSMFVGGISVDDWEFLGDPDNHFPMLNRAIQSSYPPGSVFKVIPATSALELGYLAQTSRLPCPGSWDWGPQTFHNWRRFDSGAMTLQQALVESCDTVFYELARRMWSDEEREGEPYRERLTEHARAWGLGQRTGIDLPSERAGVVPGREWKRDYWERTRRIACQQAQQAAPGSYRRDVLTDICNDGYRWRGGDAVNMSIGQGEVQSSPLQIASVFAAVANRGTLYRPRVTAGYVRADGSRELLEPEVLATLPVSRSNLDYVHAGLVGVTRGDGTSSSVFGEFPIQTAGKTGTAEYKPKQPIAWYAGYAPADAPEYVVVAMVEEGGGGSMTAAPIVRRIFEGLFGLEPTDLDPGELTD